MSHDRDAVRKQLLHSPITYRRHHHRNLTIPPAFGGLLGENLVASGGGSEHSGSSVTTNPPELFTPGMDGELVCDECHCTKRHPDMTWWWDEQCAITVCEHCCMSNHRQHRIKSQDEAERDEFAAYEKFLRDHKAITEQIVGDIDDQRKLLKNIATGVDDVRGLGDTVRCFVVKYEKKLQHIDKEMFTVKDVRLTSGTYWKRASIRDETKQTFVEVDGAMTDLMPKVDKLVKQFDQVKLSLGRWEREGMTACGGEDKLNDAVTKFGF